MTRDEVLARIVDDEEVIFLEGPEYDEAIIGVVERFGQPMIVCYDFNIILKVLQAQGMGIEEAIEWFGFNMVGAWMGDATPCFLHT